MRVLVVEDEGNIARALEVGLRSEGFDVEVEHAGDAGLWRAREGSFDAIILDLMLPGLNGYEICAQLRSEGDRTPILMLTAKDGDLDEISGFETGVVPMMLSVIVDETLGTNDIEAVALTPLTGGRIVARADVGSHTFVLVSADTPDGPATIRSDFKKVLPGRYTAIGTSSVDARSDASSYRLGFTTYNPTAGERPILVISGTNADDATSVSVVGSQVDAELPLGAGIDFVTGVELDVDANGIVPDVRLTFLDEAGTPLPAFRDVDA
jgi:CheY-like chemotaxis protein